LVNDDKAIVSIFASANGVLKINNLADLLVNVLSLRFNKLFTLLRGRVEESRVDFTKET
jgi:hypothetical protein